ncbi:MAG TPA: PTS sugar transporter [Salmonella bongori]|uniref:PTS system mannose-specific IIA component n=4 Tax=Salmonella bongori TaxID=54736 RepID=S5N4F7_SALBN|nr:PTS sugar transporter subunit IIA [Salmonella bongori]AGR61764.1 PTS system mannose-specific IIA component [Salmonella bongori N268-08]ASG56129.1 PTS sugar transporter [Salmonella bongori serovar 66:z41:- str. SA19983605]ECC9750904.1 PTS sugar transporter subunit IIA [Salmonella bongori]ECI3518031.1 PTS sugar transporter [Salmonella bongori]EDP8560958.1 PTS sugar transporter subunit IIA [Salmonella bongori]
MKRHYIFASHGTLASGILNSVELILGKRPHVWTLCAYVEEGVDLSQQVDTLLAQIPPEDEIIALTDIFAGSVNNEFIRYLSRANFHLLAGINLPLIIELFMAENDGATTHTIITALEDSKENIQYCNRTITSAMHSDKDF